MSVWTHVSGVIRFDSLLHIISSNFKIDWEEYLGKIYTFDDLMNLKMDEEATTKLPMGSEGSLRYEIVEGEYGENSIRFGTIVISGDLRSYDNLDEIQKWFSDVIQEADKKYLIIRDAVLQMHCEIHDTIKVLVVNKKQICETIIPKPKDEEP